MFCAAEIHAPATATICESVVTDGEMLPPLDCYVSSDPGIMHVTTVLLQAIDKNLSI